MFTVMSISIGLFNLVLVAQVAEHPLRELEVAGSNLARAIPKALKMVPLATLLGTQHYKASTGFPSLTNEPCCEKTGLRGFRPGLTQTRLHSHRRWLEA